MLLPYAAGRGPIVAAASVCTNVRSSSRILCVESKSFKVKVLGREVRIVKQSWTWISVVSLSWAMVSGLGCILGEMVRLPLAWLKVCSFYEGATVYLAQWRRNIISFSIAGLSRSQGTRFIPVSHDAHGWIGLSGLLGMGFGGHRGDIGEVGVSVRISVSGFARAFVGTSERDD